MIKIAPTVEINDSKTPCKWGNQWVSGKTSGVKFPLGEVDTKVHEGLSESRSRESSLVEGRPLVAVHLTVLCTLLRKMRRGLRGERLEKELASHP